MILYFDNTTESLNSILESLIKDAERVNSLTHVRCLNQNCRHEELYNVNYKRCSKCGNIGELFKPILNQ